jgi:hypothetical protein
MSQTAGFNSVFHCGVPVKETMTSWASILKITSWDFSTYFRLYGQFNEQTNVVAMKSPIYPLIANFFVEGFKGRALQQSAYKFLCWFLCVDSTFFLHFMCSFSYVLIEILILVVQIIILFLKRRNNKMKSNAQLCCRIP